MANQNNNLKMIIDSTAPQPYLPGPLISIIITELNNQQKSYFLIFYRLWIRVLQNNTIRTGDGGMIILINYLMIKYYIFP